MTQAGHAVGNHTYHHPDMSAIADKMAFQKELDDVAELFYEITGTELSMHYRPPQGKCNTENIKMAQELGYATIFWSLAYVDWDTERQPSHTEAFDKLTSRIHPGAIVLLHNTSRTNSEILDELLTKWGTAFGRCQISRARKQAADSPIGRLHKNVNEMNYDIRVIFHCFQKISTFQSNKKGEK